MASVVEDECPAWDLNHRQQVGTTVTHCFHKSCNTSYQNVEYDQNERGRSRKFACRCHWAKIRTEVESYHNDDGTQNKSFCDRMWTSSGSGITCSCNTLPPSRLTIRKHHLHAFSFLTSFLDAFVTSLLQLRLWLFVLCIVCSKYCFLRGLHVWRTKLTMYLQNAWQHSQASSVDIKSCASRSQKKSSRWYTPDYIRFSLKPFESYRFLKDLDLEHCSFIKLLFIVFPFGCFICVYSSTIFLLSCGQYLNTMRHSSTITTVTLLLLACCVGAQRSPAFYKPQPVKVCGSIDIRNSVRNMERHIDCEVIEGDLQVVLISGNPENVRAINNVSFPKLREVTGFVVLWRVVGLHSLGTLFPNLAVIRGRTLFENYALVAYEMPDLMEVGLFSLTNILRGSVRFDKNPRLCFVDTIDWAFVAQYGASGHVIADNRPKGECARCPISTSVDCITNPEPRCWNKERCQKYSTDCPGRIRGDKGECCDVNCLGGCTGPTSKDCHVCRDLTLGGDCLQECPDNLYKFLHRRCVTREDCYNMLRPPEWRHSEDRKHPFRPIGDSCLLECPANYVEVEEYENSRFYYSCKPCEGPCKKECPGANIDSIAAAQKLTGCTHITGNLEIQLRHGGSRNLAKELESSLSLIEEIYGFLKIVRSFPLISLNFLKNLKVIRGNNLDNHNSSFVLLDNQNLQELWDWDNRPNEFKILRGKLFFHFNPRLCYYKIERLREIINHPPFTEQEVPRDSNGDKEACNVTTLEPRITRVQALSVLINWKPFQNYDSRTLLGYVLYYVRAPYKNVTMYDGRDACGGDGWFVDDVPVPNKDEDKEISHPLTRLKPYTQYAYFIKTYTIKTETNGAQSSIHYFMTAPSTPTKPLQVEARSNSSSEVIIKWLPPSEFNGNLTHYIVTGQFEPDEIEEEHDYCDDPLVITNIDRPPLPPPPTLSPTNHHEDCLCNQTEVRKDTEEDRQSSISFEDALQNYFYIKRPKREVEQHDNSREINGLNGITGGSGGKSYGKSYGDSRYKLFFNETVNGTSLTVKNLQYFSRYTISVQACRAVEELGEPVVDESPPCSVTSIVYVRTKKNETADTVTSFSYERSLNDSSKIRLFWKEPERPNGLIHSYKIERVRVSEDNKELKCITRNNPVGGRLETPVRLEPGNYSFRIRAVSLAGDGPYSVVLSVIMPPKNPPGTNETWIGIIIFCFLFVALLIGFYVYWRRFTPPIPKLFPNVNPEYVSASSVYIADEWEVPRDKVELLKELGQGSFGMVYEGIAHNIVEGDPRVRCAVKTVNETATDRDRHEFLNEASVMKAFNTHHVVRLLGVVSTGQPTLVVMELMINGDLKTYLRNHRPEAATDEQIVVPPTLRRILQMAVEIADGMAYLSAKKFVHRDLAARNCMVAEDLTVKIGDFGMTRDIYETDYYKKGTGTKGLLPVRWMAPESLKDGVFTSRSDVWSYGVVLWEMVTLASQPYLGLSNDQVLRYVIEGGVMERPENCPDKLFELMQLCWQHKPTLRPPFMEFVERLLPDANEAFYTHSFYHSPEGCEIRAHEQEAQAVDLEASYGTPRTPLRAATALDDTEDFSSVCSGSDIEDGGPNALALRPPQRAHQQPLISSSDSSRGSKVSNGSAPNGIITKLTPC